MNNKKKSITILLLLFILLVIFAAYYINTSWKNNENSIEIKTESRNISVEYSKTELTGEWKDYKGKIELSDEKIVIEGSGVTNSDNEIKITTAGSYYITGVTTDANIVIEATKNDDIQLVLDNCEITSKSTAVINGIKCNLLTITSVENSTNIISDVGSYTKFTDTEKSEPDGAIFTKTDLVINRRRKSNCKW